MVVLSHLLHDLLIFLLLGLLHPVEELACGVLEPEQVHPARVALRYTLELSITREDDEILVCVCVIVSVMYVYCCVLVSSVIKNMSGINS